MKYLFILLLIQSLFSCNNNRGLKKTNGFYYWKSTFTIDADGAERLKTLNIKKLYTKYFDVVWDRETQTPQPVAVLNYGKNEANGIAIIPVVFITNETFLEMQSDRIPQFAQNVFHKIQAINTQMNQSRIPEIQMDCDWSLKSRDRYFSFLDEFDKLLNTDTALSATIRLHQVKYAETTGIPPVDRGALMFYNVSHPKELGIKNSILDLDLGKKYLAGMADYPLPLDIVLPLFSSGALFQGNNFSGLVNDISWKHISTDADFVHLNGNYFQAKKEVYVNNVYVYKNDVLRVDQCTYEELIDAAKYLSGRLNSDNVNVLLFCFGSNTFREMNNEKIRNIYDVFN